MKYYLRQPHLMNLLEKRSLYSHLLLIVKISMYAHHSKNGFKFINTFLLPFYFFKFQI